MQPRSRRAVIALDALGLAALAALFVLWCVRTPGLSAPGGITAGCSAALFAAVGLRFVPAWVRFWQREGDAPAAVPAAEPAHMGARIFAALLALDLVLLLLTWSVRALAGQPETLAQALEFWRCTDSRHYLDIARDGYIAAGDPDRVVQLVFLPGYPLVVRAVMRLIPSDICAGLLTSALCFAGAGCMIYRLLRLDLPHRDAVRALRFLALAPGCFFFAAPMSESLFLLLTAAALYLARTRRPILGGLCGAYAAFTRSLGLLLFVPLLWELVHDAVQRRRVDARQVVGALLVPLGFAAYCYINWRVSGNPFQFLIYQREHWNQRTGLFFSRRVSDGLFSAQSDLRRLARRARPLAAEPDRVLCRARPAGRSRAEAAREPDGVVSRVLHRRRRRDVAAERAALPARAAAGAAGADAVHASAHRRARPYHPERALLARLSHRLCPALAGVVRRQKKAHPSFRSKKRK